MNPSCQRNMYHLLLSDGVTLIHEMLEEITKGFCWCRISSCTCVWGVVWWTMQQFCVMWFFIVQLFLTC